MTIETSRSTFTRRAGMGVLAIGAAAVVAGAMPIAVAAADSAQETPASMVGALHSAFGEHHARAVHAKGGTFTPAPQAKELSKAKVFASDALRGF
jgi:catalase